MSSSSSLPKFTKSTKITSFFTKKSERGRKRKNKGKVGRPKKDHVKEANIISDSKESQGNIITVSLKTSTIFLSPSLLVSSWESSSSDSDDSLISFTDQVQPPDTEQSTQRKQSRIMWNKPQYFPLLQKAIQEKRRLGRLYNPVEHGGSLYVPESTLHDVMKRIGDKEPTLATCFPRKKFHCYQIMVSMFFRILFAKEIKQTMGSPGQKQYLLLLISGKRSQ